MIKNDKKSFILFNFLLINYFLGFIAFLFFVIELLGIFFRLVLVGFLVLVKVFRIKEFFVLIYDLFCRMIMIDDWLRIIYPFFNVLMAVFVPS